VKDEESNEKRGKTGNKKAKYQRKYFHFSSPLWPAKELNNPITKVILKFYIMLIIMIILCCRCPVVECNRSGGVGEKCLGKGSRNEWTADWRIPRWGKRRGRIERWRERLDNDFELLFLIVLNKGKHAKRPRQPGMYGHGMASPIIQRNHGRTEKTSQQTEILEWKAMEIQPELELPFLLRCNIAIYHRSNLTTFTSITSKAGLPYKTK
jgi:hypothetical protein